MRVLRRGSDGPAVQLLQLALRRWGATQLSSGGYFGTGTQEAGGVRFAELRCALVDILSRFNVVAMDNVELSPALDPSGRSTALACKFLREELLSILP